MTWDPIQASRLIGVSVRIESECKITDDLRSYLKAFLFSDGSITNCQQASCDAIVDDMTGSHIFRRVVSPGDPNYDLLIKLVSISSKVSAKISLSVVDINKQEVIASYDGTAAVSKPNPKLFAAAAKQILADIRTQMISDYLEGKGIGVYLAIRHQTVPSIPPTSLPTAIPNPTESNAPF